MSCGVIVTLRARLVAIDQQVPDLALFSLAVFGRCARRSRRTTSASTDRHFVAELVRGQRDHCSFTFSLRLLVLAVDVGVRQPIQSVSAERSLSIIMLRRRLSSKSLLVIGGCCDAQQLLVALLADEAAVFLQRGNGEDLLRELFVAHADALALGLDQRGLFVDHLLEDLLIDAELPHQLLVDAAAILLLVGLDLTSGNVAGNRRPVMSLPFTVATTSDADAPTDVEVVSRKLGM